MIIHIYTIGYNEEKILPYFLRHYEQFANKIFFYDNESTDSTASIIQSHPLCSLIKWLSNEEYDDTKCLALKQEVWKQSRQIADWVFVVDCDEFIWASDIKKILQNAQNNNVALLQGRGWDMVTRTFDTSYLGQIYDIVQNGVETSRYFKFSVFNPNKVKEINYSRGSHNAAPILYDFGKDQIWRASQSNLHLLHYKYVDIKHVQNKLKDLMKRVSLSKTILNNNAMYPSDIERIFTEKEKKSVNVFEAMKSPTQLSVLGLEDITKIEILSGERVRFNVNS